MGKKNINRKNLASKIYQNIGFSKVLSENIVNDIFYITSKFSHFLGT